MLLLILMLLLAVILWLARSTSGFIETTTTTTTDMFAPPPGLDETMVDGSWGWGASPEKAAIPTDELLHMIDATDASSSFGDIVDAISGISWIRHGAVVSTTEDGIACFDMDRGYIETPVRRPLGQYYTCFYLWKPRAADDGYRTLHRNLPDHLAIVDTKTRNLGMYCNRDGGFRDSGHDISTQWQTLIVTGVGESPSDPAGTTRFYVNGSKVGACDRVGCGTQLFRIGWPRQGPGKIAVAGSYNRLLSPREIEELHQILYDRLVLERGAASMGGSPWP